MILLIFVLLYFLPIHQSLSLIVQFYGKGNDFSFVGLERLGILLGSNLLGCGINTAIVAKLQFKHIDEVGGFYHHVYSARSNHLFYFHTATDGIEYSAHNKTVAFFHIHTCKFLVAVRHICYKSFQAFHGFGQITKLK